VISTVSSSTLTLRCRKAEAEAFAKGKLTLEEFRKRVQVAVN
jgi:hypothetical protein